MPFENPPVNLVGCLICGRLFEESRIAKHQEICNKSAKEKRKPFDSMKQRVRGTAMERQLDNMKARAETPPKMSHGNWRQVHEEFITMIKAAKRADKIADEVERPKPCTFDKMPTTAT